MSSLFDKDGNLQEYLKLARDEPLTESSDSTVSKDNKIGHIKQIAFKIFLARLGKENFEKYVSGKLTVAKALKIGIFYFTYQRWADVVHKEAGYVKRNKATMSTLFNHELNDLFDIRKGRKPYDVFLNEAGARWILERAKKQHIEETTTKPKE